MAEDSSASEAAPVVAGPAGNRYALIIGIKGYPNFKPVERLKYADADAKLFASFLRSPEGGAVPPENILMILNQKATKKSIMEGALWLEKKATASDTVYVFFAGHGIGNEAEEVFLMPYDGKPSSPNKLGILAKEFFGIFEHRIRHRRLVFFIDACRAGAALLRTGVGMALVSANTEQKSWEDPEFGHGLFTWYLIEGLRGAASDKYGVVSLEGAYRYVSGMVGERSKARFVLQTPTISPNYDPGFVLSRTNPAKKPARIHILKTFREGFDETLSIEKDILASHAKLRQTGLEAYDLALRRYNENARDPMRDGLTDKWSTRAVRDACQSISETNNEFKEAVSVVIGIWRSHLSGVLSLKEGYPPASDWSELESIYMGKLKSFEEESKRQIELRKKEDAGRFCP